MSEPTDADGETRPLSLFEDTEEITRRFTLAVREALRDHKRVGNPVPTWRDGRVVIVPPEEIPWGTPAPRRKRAKTDSTAPSETP